MSCFGKRVDVPGGRRTTLRQSICATGSAVAIHGSRSIIVEDTCPRGARVRGRGLPAVGEQVLIWTDHLEVLARVIWARHDERGVMIEIDDEPAALPERQAECVWSESSAAPQPAAL